jgi:hypothetical protein
MQAERFRAEPSRTMHNLPVNTALTFTTFSAALAHWP